MNRLYLLVFITLLSWNEVAQADTHKTVVLAADEWCPYNCEPNSNPPGFLIEIAQAAFSRHNMKVDYKSINWSRALRYVRQKKIDGVLGASKQEIFEEKLITGNQPVAMSYFAFIILKDNQWEFTSPQALKDIKFGIIQDYDNSPDVNEYTSTKPDNVLVQTGLDAFEKNVKLVHRGRLDAAIDDVSVAAYKLKKMGILDDFKFIPIDKTPMPLYIAFNPTSEGRSYVKILDEGVEHLRKTGELAKILAKYGLSDWK